ncbi:MAG TPA: sugar phosphate nucleotidyltransferase [Bryobacteraceae bacterium]|nr:sugar phosphate nucleotidyltransferase [Bryobacteraceae bacterium]
MLANARTATPDLFRSHPRRWGVILAGGDGSRLLPLTRQVVGDDRPKQFCALIDDETLLRQTRQRISSLVSPERTLVVLTKTHERYFEGNLDGVPLQHQLIQPSNRDTAPAILYSLLRVREADPQAVVAFFPSDHYFADDAPFVEHVDAAFAAVEARPESLLLLGVVPDTPETGYGWIEPGDLLCDQWPGPICRISQFWEKPSHEFALDLMGRGCLWNSFVMVCHVGTLLSLIRHMLPRLYDAFESIRSSFLTMAEDGALSRLYSAIRPANFSHEVLSSHPYDSVHPCVLSVMRGANLGWSDLGEPGRVLSAIERKGAQSERLQWAVATAG